VPSPRIFNQEV